MTVVQFTNQRSEKIRLVESIVEQIENVIIERELKAGDKLPPSREFQKMLGISQGTLREALRILGQKGLVEAKLGRNGGLYVKAVTSEIVSDSLRLLIRQKQVSLDHLAVFRSSLEVSAASLAAIEAEKVDIRDLKKLMREAQKHLTKGIEGWKTFYRVEDRMHHALVWMTRNPLFESVLITVYQTNPGYNFELIPKKIENMEDTYRDWSQILEAIESRRPDKAGWIMTRHIQRFLPSTKKVGA
jgi:GntR family transcriptional regulator, transcriptional repressor for pyruvate dehydrogenase complex